MTEFGTTEIVLGVIKLVNVALGALLIYLGLKAYRRSGRKPLLWLAVGMGVMTIGVVSEALAYQALGWELGQSHVFEAIVTLLAFAVVLYSLYF